MKHKITKLEREINKLNQLTMIANGCTLNVVGDRFSLSSERIRQNVFNISRRVDLLRRLPAEYTRLSTTIIRNNAPLVSWICELEIKNKQALICRLREKQKNGEVL